MDNSFNSLVDSATSVLVLLPTKPYFDQVAAGLALYLSIHDKKSVSISCPSPMMVGFNRLIGVDKISGEIGNKNLTIQFAGYEAGNIEKVSYDIENGEFKLTVIPKTGFAAPQKEQINLTYSGAAADLVILVGGANDSHFPMLSFQELTGAKIAHIGTRTLVSEKGVMSFAKPGASTSELVASLIKENSMNIDADVATNLALGIEEGSSNFASSEVTPETFETFAYLLRSGAQRLPKTRLSPMNFPPGAIPTKPFNSAQGGSALGGQPVPQPAPVAQDVEGTQETEQVINPPDDWLQPKVYKGASANQPDTFSENKG